MKFTIVCVALSRNESAGWRYQVVLWFKRTRYVSEKDYAHYGDALRAAKATGALPMKGN